MEAFDRLKQLVAEAEIEVLKGEGGNKAAKVRARKKMQEIKNAAQDVRTGLLEAGGEGEEGGESGGAGGGGGGGGAGGAGGAKKG